MSCSVWGRPPVFFCFISALVLAVAFPAAGQICSYPVGLNDFGSLNKAPVDVFVAGNLVYAADQFGLGIYDVGVPASPRKLGQVMLPERPEKITVVDDLAFVADGRAGLVIVSLQDSSAPRILAACDTPGEARDVVIIGTAAIVADHREGLQIIDIRNPAQPTILAQMFDQDVIDHLISRRRLVYVAVISAIGSSYLEIISIQDPLHPEVVGSVRIADPSTGIAWSEGHIFLGTSSGLIIVDTSDPSNPVIEAEIPTDEPVSDVGAHASRVFPASGEGGLKIIDVSDPSNPVFEGWMTTPGGVDAVTAAGSTLFLSDEEYGLWLVDVSDPLNPETIGIVESPGEARRVVVEDGTAFVADDAAGLAIFDVSNPDEPRLNSIFPLNGTARDLAISDGIAFIAAGEGGLEIIDISDSLHPSRLAELPMSEPTDAVDVSDSRAYLSHQSESFSIIDVSDPENPVLLNTIVGFGAGELAVSGNVLFSVGYSRIYSIDVENPFNPTIIGVYWTELSQLKSMEVRGHYLFMTGKFLAGDENIGMQIVDFEQPGNLERVGACPTPENSTSIHVMGNLAFVGTDSGEIEIINITDLSRPVPIATDQTHRGILGFGGDDERSVLWIAEGVLMEGLRIDCPDCGGVEIVSDPETIVTGGQATITVMVRNNAGQLVAGQLVSGTTDLGALSEFIDLGDGSYQAILQSDSLSGMATVTVSVNASVCQQTATVSILCGDGVVSPVTPTAAAIDDSSIQISWEPAENATGYRVSRDAFPIASLTPDTTLYRDTDLSPGMEFTYSVGVLDVCGGEWPSADVSASTTGDRITCPVHVAKSPLEYRNSLHIGRVTVKGNRIYGVDRHGLGIWEFASTSSVEHRAHWHAPEAGRGIAVSDDGLALLADGDSGLFLIDVRYSSHPHLLASFETAGWAENVAMEGNFAFIAEKETGIEIIDISDPYSPLGVGLVDTPGEARALSVSGGFLYVADGTAGFTIVDVRDPWNSPAVISNLPGRNWEIALSGDVVCVTSAAFMRIVDVSDPFDPVPQGGFSTFDPIGGVAVSDHFAYITDGDKVTRLDINDPWNPVEVFSFALSRDSKGIAVDHGFLVVSLGDKGLSVFDINMIGFAQTPGDIVDMEISGSHAYAVLDPSSLAILDLTDSMHPVAVSSLPLPGTANAVAVQGDTALISVQDAGLAIVDIQDPLHPTLHSTLNWENASAVDVAARGQMAYVADSTAGLELIDFSDPPHPVGTAAFDITGGASRIAVSGDFAFVVGNDGMLRVVDVADPADPQLSTMVDLPDEVNDIVISGQLAFVSIGTGWWGNRNLYVLDISDPSSPEATDFVDHVSADTGLKAVGDYLYVAGGRYLSIYFIGDQGHSERVARMLLRYEWPRALAVSESAVYVAEEPGGLSVFDVVDSAHPERLPVDYQTRGNTRDIAVMSNTAYVANGLEGLIVMDVSDPAMPVVLNRVDTLDDASDVESSDGFLYLADSKWGLRIFNVDDPAAPVEVGRFSMEDFVVKNVCVENGRAYMADGNTLIIVDVSDPSDPHLLGSLSTGYFQTHAEKITVDAGIVHLLSSDDYWSLIDVGDPAAPVLLSRVFEYQVQDIEVANGIAYLTDFYNFKSYDIHDPSTPIQVSSMEIQHCRRIDISGTLGFVTTSAGLAVIDLSKSDELRLIGEVDTAGWVYDVTVRDKVAYLVEAGQIEIMTLPCKAPSADFEADVRGRSVEFRDRSLFGHRLLEWDFGDGSTSSMPDVSHAFPGEGLYTVRLSVANDYGGDTFEKTIRISLENIFSDDFESGDFSNWSFAAHSTFP